MKLMLIMVLGIMLILGASPATAEDLILYFQADGDWNGGWFLGGCSGGAGHPNPDPDDDAIICADVTCTMDINADIETITLQDGATLNIGTGKRLKLNEAEATSTIGTGAVINLDGTIRIDSPAASVFVYFVGDGEIVGNDSVALIEIDAAHTLKTDITIRGMLEIGRIDDTGTGTFENRGTVHADRSGTLKLTAWNVGDGSPGGGVTPQWKVTHSGATLEFAAPCAPSQCLIHLIGDFEVTKGLLLATKGFRTDGVLTQRQGGVIEIPGQYQVFFNKQP